jgi:beta-glucanase (GH16 family)
MRNLVWSDEFDGSSLDYGKWDCQVNAFGGGNQELQLYTDRPRNVRVENGCLVLEAHRERFGVEGTMREFTSGRVRTKHRGDGKYGRYASPKIIFMTLSKPVCQKLRH